MSGDETGSDSDRSEPNVLVRVLQSVTPGPIRQSFAIKFGLVLAVMALSIGGIGIAATERITDETEDNVIQEYQSVAKQEGDIMEQWLQRNALSTQLTSSESTWVAANSSVADLELSLDYARADLASDVNNVHLINSTTAGIQVVASTSLQPATNVADVNRSWLLENASLNDLQTNGVAQSDVYVTAGRHVVGFVSPVGTVEGQNRFLLVEVRTNLIRESLQGQQRAAGGFTQVVDGSETVMIDERANRSTAANTLGRYASDDGALSVIGNAQSLRNASREAGVEPTMPATQAVINEQYTVGYSPVEVSGLQTDWVVLVHAPRSSVFGFVQTISTWGLFATIASIVLIGAVGAMLGYNTSTSIDRLTRKTEQMREGDLEVTFYTSRVDNIGRLYDGFAEMRDALKEQIEEAERERKKADVARAEAEEMSTYLQDKADEYSDIMEQVAAGDLTQRMTQDGENDSMDRIATEFNEMVEELEKTTGQLKSFADEVEMAGEEVEKSAETVREASEQVADSIQTISDDAYDQKERLQDISESMDSIVAQLEEFDQRHQDVDIAESLERISEIATKVSETADLSESTMAEAENVAGAAEEQAAELNEVGERARDLQRYSQPLRDILQRFVTEAEHEFVFSVGPSGDSGTGGEDEE